MPEAKLMSSVEITEEPDGEQFFPPKKAPHRPQFVVQTDTPRTLDRGPPLATSRRKIGVLRRGNQQCDATQIAPG